MNNLDNQLKSIVHQFNNKNYKIAYSSLKSLLKKNPNNLELHNVNYQISIKLDLINDAINSLIFLNNNKPKDIFFLLKLYKLLIKIGDLEKALFYINRIIKINNNEKNILRDKAYILYLQNEIEEATKYIDLALKNNSNDYFTLNLKGLILTNKKKYNDAIFYFNNSISINTNFIDGYINLGNCYYELEDFKKSFYYFKKSYKLNKNNISSLINISNLLSLKNKFEFTEKLLNKALKIDPINKNVLYNLCICFFRKQDVKKSKKYFNKLIKIDPDNHDLKYAYSTFNLGIENYTDGWHYFDSRIYLKKNYKSFKNFDVIKNKLVKVEELNKTDKILVLREQGIGEEILFSSIYSKIFKNFDNIKIETDKRLIEIFKRSFFKKAFYEDGYYSNSINKIMDFDKVVYAGSFLKLFRNKKNSFDGNKYLRGSSKKINILKKEFENSKKLKIGISWKSVLNIYGKFKSLSINNFYPLFNDRRYIINLQYGDCLKEISDLKKNNLFIHNIKNIDLFYDLDTQAALLSNLDFFVTISNSTAHLAGALGIKTILICPSKSTKYFYWNTENNKSIWYNSIHVVSLEQSTSQTFKKINSIIAAYE